MTYKDLLTNLQNLTEEQLNREVLLYNFEEDLLLDNEVTALRVTEYDSPGLISKGTPYIVFWIMALSNSTITNLAVALTPDVIDDIYDDERFNDLMMQLIPEFVAKKLQSEDYDLVAEISVGIMDNLTLRAVKVSS